MTVKEYQSTDVRNVAFLGHSGSGKSTLAESMLFSLGCLDRMGRTEDGNLASDYDPEEIKRHISINTSVLPVELKDGIKINLLDCPGNRDFIGEIKGALHVAEGALIFVDATSGVQVGTELALEYANEWNLPVAAFVNKLDKENANFAKTVEAITTVFNKKAVPLTCPIGSQADFKGVVDLMRMKAVEEANGKVKYADIPADLMEEAETLREQLVEAAAEGEEALMEKFFDEGALSEEEVARGLKAAFIEGSFIPVFCGSALKGIGLNPLFDFFKNSFPNPLEGPGLAVVEGETETPRKIDPNGPFAAFVFKTVADDFAGRLTYFKVASGKMTPATPMQNNNQNKSEKAAHLLVSRGKKQDEVGHVLAGDIGVVAKLTATTTNDTLADIKNPVIFAPTRYPQRSSIVAISAKQSKDEDKVGIGLHAMMEQDPTLNVVWDPEISQNLFSGMGDQHLDVALERLRAKAKVEIEIKPPKIRYRETVTKKAEGFHRHKKQSGGRGQFAEVHLRLSPSAEQDYEFTWSVFGGAIPTNYQSAIDKGSQMALEKGILAGYHVKGIHVDCFDGKYHPVDSSDMAFQIATMQAFKKIALEAGPIILEPICLVTTTVPEHYMGDVMGDVSQRRGRIQGSENVGNKVVVKAIIPEAEMASYAQNLRSITGGRGSFEREFAHYDPVPREVQEKIIAESDKVKAEEEE
ncbi:MAG TPA: elongation factor G [Candidatus Sumerlaeota bacterium]|nr:elongation factor G [Candidatus Sumerlaeota bacterium]